MVCVPLESVTVAVATLVPDAKPAAAFLASSGEMEASILASLSLLTMPSTALLSARSGRGLRISHSFCPFLPNSTD